MRKIWMRFSDPWWKNVTFLGVFACTFLLSTYEIWKVLISLAKKKKNLLQIFTFKDFLNLKNEFRAKKNFRLSRGVAVGFWTKFEAHLAQPC
jgi:hypothetical protein